MAKRGDHAAKMTGCPLRRDVAPEISGDPAHGLTRTDRR
jgi:hypothetical protein